MTAEYGRRKRASISVSYVGQPEREAPTEVVIRQGLNRHDVVEIIYQQSNPWVASLTTGTPVVITWGNMEGSSVLPGYVTHTSPTTSVAMNQPAKVYCIGASYPLKERGTDVWLDMTGPQIAERIARKFRLQLVADTDAANYRLPQVAQAGRTYWEVLLDLADRTGYVVRCEGVSLLFRRRDAMIDSGMSSAAVLSMGQEPHAGNLHPERGLWHFRPKIGGYLEGEAPLTSMSVSGVDPITAEYVTTTTRPRAGGALRVQGLDPQFTSYPSDRVVTNHFAASKTSAAKSEGVRMSVQADATASGDVRTRPGAPVYIRQTGSTTDGYWVVDSVVHTIFASGEYEMDLKLLTDSIGPAAGGSFRPTSPPDQPYRNLGPTAVDVNRPLLTPNLLPAKSGSKGQYWAAGGVR